MNVDASKGWRGEHEKLHEHARSSRRWPEDLFQCKTWSRVGDNLQYIDEDDAGR